MSDRKEREAAQAVIDELTDRRGFDDWWFGIDEEIQQEILDTITEIILEKTR